MITAAVLRRLSYLDSHSKRSTVIMPRQFDERGPAHTTKVPLEDPGNTTNPLIIKKFMFLAHRNTPKNMQRLDKIPYFYV